MKDIAGREIALGDFVLLVNSQVGRSTRFGRVMLLDTNPKQAQGNEGCVFLAVAEKTWNAKGVEPAISYTARRTRSFFPSTAILVIPRELIPVEQLAAIDEEQS